MTHEIYHSKLMLAMQRAQLSITAYHVLLILKPGGNSMTRVAKQAEVSTANATGVCDKLVERGLIARHPVPNDRRGILIQLTPAGMALLAEIREAVNQKKEAA